VSVKILINLYNQGGTEDIESTNAMFTPVFFRRDPIFRHFDRIEGEGRRCCNLNE